MAYKVHLDTCPFCGRADTAQLIPHGIGVTKFFIVRCVVKRGGCGASVTGKTRRLAEKAWNRNPPEEAQEGAGE